MIFDYNVVWEALPMYFGGLLTTLKLLAISLFFGLLAAIPLGLMRVSSSRWSTLLHGCTPTSSVARRCWCSCS